MKRARAFFLVCAGAFLLALAYHIGARNAESQTTGTIECAAVDFAGGGTLWFAVVDRYLYFQCDQGDCSSVALWASAPVPGSARVVGCGAGHVVLENGDAYQWNGPRGGPGTWQLIGHFPGGATVAKSETWGAMKARYR